MRVRICVGFVWLVAAMLLVLSGCRQAAGPDDTAQRVILSSTPSEAVSENVVSVSGITHILIASVEMQFLAFTENPNVVSEVAALLTEAELGLLARRRMVHVQDPSVASTIATIVGLDVSDPVVREGGLLVTTYTEATWGRVKCCYKEPKCCPKKKKEQ